MKQRFLLIAVGIAVLSSISLFSQREESPIDPVEPPSPIYLGPVIGYNKSMHTVEMKTFAEEPLCPTFINGSDNGFFAGFSFEYMLGEEVEKSNSSIIARLLYNSLPATLEQNDLDFPTRIAYIDGNDTIDIVENTSVIHLNEIKYDIVTFEVMYKFNPIPGSGLGITGGPTFDFALTKTQEQRMDLVKPMNAQFKKPIPGSPQDKGYRYENNDRSIIITEGDIPESSAFRLGLKVGVQYEILMGSGGLYIVPSLFYNFGVTNLSSEFDWRVNALQLGVDFRFSMDRLPFIN